LVLPTGSELATYPGFEGIDIDSKVVVVTTTSAFAAEAVARRRARAVAYRIVEEDSVVGTGRDASIHRRRGVNQ
jgi:hypothetical protein